MAMSNSPIGGPNFNQVSRLPNAASGAPAQEAGAEVNTKDAVSLGQPGNLLAPTQEQVQDPQVQHLSPQHQELSPSRRPTVSNAPTVLTVGDQVAGDLVLDIGGLLERQA